MILDRVIETISPTWGANRRTARKKLALMGDYRVPIAAADKYSRSLRRFRPPLSSGKTDYSQAARDVINSRAYYLARNDAIGGGAIGRLTNYVIGDGLWPNSVIDYERAGITKDFAFELQDKLEKDFREWAQSQYSCYRWARNFNRAQSMAFWYCLVSGEIFFNVVDDDEPEGPEDIDYYLRHQLIDPDRVSNPHFRMDTPDVISGIYFDEKGRAKKVWITEKHPSDVTDPRKSLSWQEYDIYIDDRKQLHHLIWKADKEDSVRGTGILTLVLDRIFDLSRYREAEILAAIQQGNVIMGLFSDDDSSFFSNREKDPRIQYSDNQVALSTATLIEGGEDDRLEMVNPTRPNSNYVGFVQEIKKEIAAAIGIPHQILEMLFDASFSASRGALMQFGDFVDMERAIFGREFCQPHYQYFIDEGVESGRYRIENYDDKTVRNAITRSLWRGKPIGTIDEGKQAQAAKTRTDARLTSKQHEREKLQLDNELIEQQIEREEELIRKRRNQNGSNTAA